MSLGGLVRNILGDQLFSFVARFYRSLFVDLEAVARAVAKHVPQGASILDIGGGDGAPLNFLLKLRPDIRVTMIDLSPRLGGAIDAGHRDRVTIMPSTSIRQYAESTGSRPDCILISDVVHHVPVDERLAFFSDLNTLVGQRRIAVIIKDVEPGHFRALLGLLADRYISGDRNTALVSRAELTRIVTQGFGPVARIETELFQSDKPNYALVFTRA